MCVASFGVYLLKDFVSSGEGQERMEYLFYGFCGYPSVKCCLLPLLVIDFGWTTVGVHCGEYLEDITDTN